MMTCHSRATAYQLVAGFVFFAVPGIFGEALAVEPAAAKRNSKQEISSSKSNVEAFPATHMESELSEDLPRVRIKIKLTPFADLSFKTAGGQLVEKRVQEKSVEHILRARIETTNHFHFQDFHIESVPVRWHKQSQEYSVLLNVFRKYGADQDVEEKLGSVRVDGVLEEQGAKLFSLVAHKETSFLSVRGEKQLTLAAGSAPSSDRTREQVRLKALSKLEPESK